MTGYRAVLIVTVLAGLSACGSKSTAAKPASTTSAPTTTTVVAQSGTITVEASDFAFEAVPPVVASGATFTLHNTSTTHVHEMVAVKLPATEHRSLAALTKLSHADLVAALGVRPTFVLLQPPGGAVIKGIGDGTVTEPGRYILICSVQLDVTPAKYFNELLKHPGEAPEIPGDGEPHYTRGMYAGFTVVGP